MSCTPYNILLYRPTARFAPHFTPVKTTSLYWYRSLALLRLAPRPCPAFFPPALPTFLRLSRLPPFSFFAAPCTGTPPPSTSTSTKKTSVQARRGGTARHIRGIPWLRVTRTRPARRPRKTSHAHTWYVLCCPSPLPTLRAAVGDMCSCIAPGPRFSLCTVTALRIKCPTPHCTFRTRRSATAVYFPSRPTHHTTTHSHSVQSSVPPPPLPHILYANR